VERQSAWAICKLQSWIKLFYLPLSSSEKGGSGSLCEFEALSFEITTTCRPSSLKARYFSPEPMDHFDLDGLISAMFNACDAVQLSHGRLLGEPVRNQWPMQYLLPHAESSCCGVVPTWSHNLFEVKDARLKIHLKQPRLFHQPWRSTLDRRLRILHQYP